MFLSHPFRHRFRSHSIPKRQKSRLSEGGEGGRAVFRTKTSLERHFCRPRRRTPSLKRDFCRSRALQPEKALPLLLRAQEFGTTPSRTGAAPQLHQKRHQTGHVPSLRCVLAHYIPKHPESCSRWNFRACARKARCLCPCPRLLFRFGFPMRRATVSSSEILWVTLWNCGAVIVITSMPSSVRASRFRES